MNDENKSLLQFTLFLIIGTNPYIDMDFNYFMKKYKIILPLN